MSWTDEQLMAYVDGETDADTRAAIDAARAHDAELDARLKRQQRLRAALPGAFAATLQEPVPDRLVAAARGQSAASSQDRVVPLAPRAKPAPPRFALPQWAAMAASLVVGIGVGYVALRAPEPATTLAATGVLDAALSGQLAADPSAQSPVRIGVSYRSQSGVLCRSFVYEAQAGVACRQDDAWQLRALLPAAGVDGGEFGRASTALPPELAGWVERDIAGEPLDAAAEQEAKARGWRP